MEEKPHLGTLTKEQVRNIISLKNAYSEFWESVKFSKGWDSPVAEIFDVLHLLEEAAEIVVRIRTYLDFVKKGPKFRIIDGNAKEYLWTLEKMPKEENFIRELVHATLKHGSTYVEDLSVEKVNQLIKDVQDYNAVHQADKLALEAKVLEDKILSVWNETDVLLKGTCVQENKFWNPSLIKDMQQMLTQINNVKQRLLLIQKKRLFNEKRTQEAMEVIHEPPTTPSKPAETEPAEVTETLPKEPEESSEEKLKREEKEKEEKERREREEEERRLRDKDREGMLKITSVAKEASDIEKELKEMSEIASSLTKSKGIKAVEAMDQIGELKKRCLKNSTKLMNDLLTLDELVGLQEARSAKKEQVTHIQHLLDNVEGLKSKLNNLEVEIKPLVSKEKEAELEKMVEEELEHLAEQQQKKEQKQEQQKHQEQKVSESVHHPELKKQKIEKNSQEQKTPPQFYPAQNTPSAPLSHPRFDLRSAWDRLKLDPKMEVHETPEHYIIMGNIPGIHKNEIDTTVLPDGTLQISGVRLPSNEEISQMRRQIRTKYNPKSNEEEDMLLLKLGVGRFGRFVKKYQLPEGLDMDSIQGQYKDGILLIRIPKPPPVRKAREVPIMDFHPFMQDVPFWGNSRFF